MGRFVLVFSAVCFAMLSPAEAQWRFRTRNYQPLPVQQRQPYQPQPSRLVRPSPPVVFGPVMQPEAPNYPVTPVRPEVDRPFDPSVVQMHLPPSVRAWFRNPDGSCVQCSEGMVGVENNLPSWTTLLWDSDYGRAERGGSYPSRVAAYAKKRGMRMYNVTGDTWPWMEWCAKTGRFAAIGAGGSHFQTLYGRDFKQGIWYVCNNNSTHKVDEYTWESFQRLHRASGEWVVIPDEPACPPPPEIVVWWQ